MLGSVLLVLHDVTVVGPVRLVLQVATVVSSAASGAVDLGTEDDLSC